MVGTKQGTNTLGKDKNTMKKKVPKKDEVITNSHGVFMENITIREKVDDSSRGISRLFKPNEFKRKK